MEKLNGGQFISTEIGYGCILEDRSEDGVLVGLLLTEKEINEGIILADKYPQHIDLFGRVKGDLYSEKLKVFEGLEGPFYLDKKEVNLEKTPDLDRHKRNGWDNREAALDKSDYSVQYYEKELFQKMFKAEVLEVFAGYTLEYPKEKGDNGIYFKSEFCYRSGRYDTLYLTNEEMSRGLTLVDKYPQHKDHIKYLIDEGYEDYFWRRSIT